MVQAAQFPTEERYKVAMSIYVYTNQSEWLNE